jgi:hypothetical protein
MNLLGHWQFLLSARIWEKSMIKTMQRVPYREAVALAAQIEATVIKTVPADRPVVELIAELGNVIEALPIPLDELVFLRNWLRATLAEWAVGSRGAARYQARYLRRRLQRLEAAWY